MRNGETPDKRTTDENDRRPRVAVVGAGMAGLAAAREAALAGAAVTVFDARQHIGGRSRTVIEKGFSLNEGAHALYVGGTAQRYLQSIGRDPAGGQPDPAAGVGVDGATVGQMPMGPKSLLRSPLLKGDRLRFAKMFAGLARLDPAEFADRTVNQAVRDLLGTGRAAALGHAVFRLSTYGHDPEQASADAGVMQLKGSDRGVRYVDGGWQTMVDGLRADVEAAGGVIETERKVHAIDRDADGVVVVDDSGPRPFDAVVLAAGGPVGASKLLSAVSTSAAAWGPAARAACVASFDVGLDVPWGDAPTFALGIDQPLYLSVHGPVADLAPSGHSLVSVHRYLHPDEPVDADRDRHDCEQFLDRIRPGWRDHAAHVEFRRRLVAATTQPLAATGGLAGRPSVGVPDAPGVFVAGDWVGPEGLLVDAVVASGVEAGRAAAVVRPAMAA